MDFPIEDGDFQQLSLKNMFQTTNQFFSPKTLRSFQIRLEQNSGGCTCAKKQWMDRQEKDRHPQDDVSNQI